MSFIAAAQAYLSSPDLEAELRAELQPIVDAAGQGDAPAQAELQDRFFEPLAFGTGGLRGLMGAGLRRMNRPTVRRTTLALARITKAKVPGRKRALVGYDTRLQSDTFALEAARTLAAEGFEVFLGNRPLPTPYLCFAMRQLGTACGIIITASHNPKVYNGYKAYDQTGGQVVAPWDTEIEALAASLPQVPPAPPADATIQPIPQEIEEAFLAMNLSILQKPAEFIPAKLLYTPFHGTGIAFTPEVFRRAGLPLDICAAQAVQDGTFPTAPRPNPEEMAAFTVTLEDAERMGSEAILASDPDADRLGILIRGNGGWVQMTGNDTAALMVDYLASQKGLKGAVVSTVVTSDFLAEVARRHGLPMVWTLTGFKNIAVCMNRLEETGEPYAFGAEESIGSLPTSALRDKDGITAAVLAAEMIGHYKAKGMDLMQAVEALQRHVGVFHNRLVNLEDPRPGGAQRFAEAMSRIRAAGLMEFAGQAVVSWEDFLACEWHGPRGQVEPILDRPDRRDVARPIEKSNVLKFRLADGAFAAFRPSGTEPKLKVYLQSRTDTACLDRMEQEARRLLGLDA